MKKSANVDIRNLFKRFDGDANNYQEIQQDYIVGKAQNSWPIIKAMEKERAAISGRGPTLRTPPVSRAPREHTAVPQVANKLVNKPTRVADPPVSNSVFGMLHPETPAVRAVPPAEVVKVSDKEAATLSSVFARTAHAPATSHTLHDALNAITHPEATAKQAVSMPTHSTPGGARPAQSRSQQNELGAVFSRLLDSPVSVNPPEGDLRSILGFLKK